MACGTGSALSGHLRVSAAVTLARLHIIPRLDRFLEAHPGLSVEFVLSDKPADLIRERIDVALRTGKLSDSSLTARKLATCRRHVLGAPAYFDKVGLPSAPTDLNRHSAIVYTQQRVGLNSETWTLRQGIRETSITLATRLRVSAAEGVRAAVIGGLGFTVASEWMFAPEIASGAVRTALEDWRLPDLDLWALFPEGRQANVRARAFSHFVQKEMRWATGGTDARPAIAAAAC